MSSPAISNSIPFSHSPLWDLQNAFFKESGIDAWNNHLPFQVTNNLSIANAHANVIIRFFQEYISRHPTDPKPNPFIIVELGAGIGMFAFYLLKELLALRIQLNRPDLTFKYIMTDFSTKTIAFWRSHPALRPYVQYGDKAILDFAEYPLGEDVSSLHLLESGLDLNHTTYGNEHSKPWIVIANYTFDSVPHDIFQVKDGNLFVGLTSNTPPTIDESISKLNDVGKGLQELGISLEYHPIDLPYYHHERLDALLLSYKNTLPNQNFLFPIIGLKGIDNLLHLSGQKLCLIATDKASVPKPPPMWDKAIVLHGGAFSLTANFHAIRTFFQAIGGQCLDQPTHQATITTSFFLAGEDLQSFYETTHSFSTFFINYDPFFLYDLSFDFLSTLENGDEWYLLSYLNLIRWDPEAVNRCSKILIQKVKLLNATRLKPFIEGMHRCGELFYYLPGYSHALINVGNFFYEIADFATALAYFEKVVGYFGNDNSTDIQPVFHKLSSCRHELQKASRKVTIQVD